MKFKLLMIMIMSLALCFTTKAADPWTSVPATGSVLDASILSAFAKVSYVTTRGNLRYQTRSVYYERGNITSGVLTIDVPVDKNNRLINVSADMTMIGKSLGDFYTWCDQSSFLKLCMEWNENTPPWYIHRYRVGGKEVHIVGDKPMTLLKLYSTEKSEVIWVSPGYGVVMNHLEYTESGTRVESDTELIPYGTK